MEGGVINCDELLCAEELNVSDTSVSSSERSSDYGFILAQIRNDAKKLKLDQALVATAVQETLTAPQPLKSEKLSTIWLKLNNATRMSLINYTVVVYSTKHFLMFYDMVTEKKEFFTPHMSDNNTGISTFAGVATMNVFGVADIAIKSKVFIFDFPSFNIITMLSDSCEGTYEDIAFSGDRMVMTMKRSTVVSLTLWDWKRKVKFFTVERQSFSTKLCLRGDNSVCSFALMAMGKMPHLDVWEMSVFSNIISLLTKYCDEDKNLSLTDLCLDQGEVYAVDATGHIYQATKLSADHLKFLRIISNYYEYAEETKDKRGPFICMCKDSLAVYGPQLVIRMYIKEKTDWVEHNKIKLEHPILHLLAPPSGEYLVAWDEKQGIVKITETEIKVMTDTRMTSKIREFEIIHPDDACCATLHENDIIKFWTIDEGFYVSELALDQPISTFCCHPFVSYMVLSNATHGELIIVDVQEIKRPKVYKIIYLTFEPLSSVSFNYCANWIFACGGNKESIFLVYGDTRQNFRVKKGLMTRYPFSCLTTVRGSVDREWVVLLLTNYKNSQDQYIQLLTIPTLSEACIINLNDSYSSLHCSTKFALLLLGVKKYDVEVHEICLDQKQGTLENKVCKTVQHLFPPLKLYLDRYHVLSYGTNDGCVTLYGSEISESYMMASPIKYGKILKAQVTRRPKHLIILTQKSELITYKIEVPCGHADEKHAKQDVSYPNVKSGHSKALKKIKRDLIPWDEKSDLNDITSYKGGVTKVMEKKLYPHALNALLNSADKETKFKTLKECQGNYDPNIVIAYIKKWLTHYRAVAKKFVEHNTYLEKERKSEMIPWESVRKVEARANTEYHHAFKRKIKSFEEQVGSQLILWRNRYERILHDTWNVMSHNPRHLKMIFRSFHSQDFGFLKERESEYRNIDKKIQFSYSDAIMHSSSQNLIWDARFECYANYWPEYYRYLIDEVEGHEEEGEKVQEEEDAELLVENYDEFFITESPLEEKTSAAAIFQRKFDSKGGLTSCISMSMNKARRAMDVASNLLMIRKGENASMEKFLHDPSSWSHFDMYNQKNVFSKFTKRMESESVESLFVDSEEDCFDYEEDKAAYIRTKKNNLKRLLFQYPYLDEMHSDLFLKALKLPEDFPEDCIFRASQGLPYEVKHLNENEKFILETCSAVDLFGYNTNQETSATAEVAPPTEEIPEQEQPQAQQPPAQPAPDVVSIHSAKDAQSIISTVPTPDTVSIRTTNEVENDSTMEKLININDIPVSDKILTARRIFEEKEKNKVLLPSRVRSVSKTRKLRKLKSTDDQSDSQTTNGTIAAIDYAEENRKKRLVKDMAPKSTDVLNIIIKTEEEMNKVPQKPIFLLAKKDIAKLYLMLDVEILLEIAKKKKNKKKNSLDKESLEDYKQREAEEKNLMMSTVYSVIKQELSDHIAKAPSLTSVKSLSKNLDKRELIQLKEMVGQSSSQLVLNTLLAEKKEDSSAMEVERERRTIIVGDIMKLKKRRIILGKKVELSKSNTDAEGKEFEVLPANYVTNHRNKIKMFIIDNPATQETEEGEEGSQQEDKEQKEKEDKRKTSEPVEGEEEAAEEEESQIACLDLEELCWLQGAKLNFELSKMKKLEEESVPLTFEIQDDGGNIDEFFEMIGRQSSATRSSVKDADGEMAQVGFEKEREKEAHPVKVTQLKAMVGISTIEDGIFFLMIGSTAHLYVTTNIYRASQLINTSALNIESETAHDKKVLYDVMSYFNLQFDSLRKVKEGIMEAIQDQQKEFFFLVNEISVSCKENHVFPKMPAAEWSQYENPEKIITVEDSEVPVEKFFTPSEIGIQKYLNAIAGGEHLNPVPDPFRIHALLVMMDGVVEKRWEDELKKDVPYPQRLVDKEPMTYDAEDFMALKEYEQAVEERNEERRVYKGILLEKIDKVIHNIEMLHTNFDWRVKQIDEKALEFSQIINEENLRSVRRYREKAKEILFLRIIEQARTFTEAARASMDQIEGLIKALSQRMKLQKEKLSNIRKKRDLQEEKLEGVLHKSGVIPADRSYVMLNYVRPVFNIQDKFNHAPFLITVLENFDQELDPNANPNLVEIFKDIKQAMKKNCPQKFSKAIWDILIKGRKEHIHSDIEIAILQNEFFKAEETAKFFKGYLKQKRNFSDMIKKAVENSIQRYKMSQHLKEYQVVLPMGMIEVRIGWEERGEPPTCSDLLLLPSQEYEDLLTDKFDVDMEYAFEQWLNEYYSHDIDILQNRHYDLMTEEKELQLTIKHIEKFQHTSHSRTLIRSIKETGVHPGGWENKAEKIDSNLDQVESAYHPKTYDQLPKKTSGLEEEPEETYFIDPTIKDVDYRLHEGEWGSSEEEFEMPAVEPSEEWKEPDGEEASSAPLQISSEDDLTKAPPMEYLFMDDMENEGMIREEYSKSEESELFKQEEASNKMTVSMKSKDFEQMEEDYRKTITAEYERQHEDSSIKTIKVRKNKKFRKKLLYGSPRASKKTVNVQDNFHRLRELKIMGHYKVIRSDLKNIYNLMLKSIKEIMGAYLVRPERQELNFEDLTLPFPPEELKREGSGFSEKKMKYLYRMEKEIKKNMAVFYPMVSAEEKEVFLATKPMKFDALEDVERAADEILYDKDKPELQPDLPMTKSMVLRKDPDHQFVSTATNTLVQEEYLKSLLRQKEQFKFTGDWHQNLIHLWQELNKIKSVPKKMQRDLTDMKRFSLLGSYWEFSEFNFKKGMKDTLVSLLKSYKGTVSKYANEYKKIEKEITKYINMNTKCVQVFFTYELSLSRDEENSEIQEISKENNQFSAVRNHKIQMAMRKARLLREIQKNQYDIMTLQSELELLHLKTYPILMFKRL